MHDDIDNRSISNKSETVTLYVLLAKRAACLYVNPEKKRLENVFINFSDLHIVYQHFRISLCEINLFLLCNPGICDKNGCISTIVEITVYEKESQNLN